VGAVGVLLGISGVVYASVTARARRRE